MAEILYIRLGSQAQDEISWLIFSSAEHEIIASGKLNHAEQLSELTEKAQQREVKVFVPGADVLLKRLTVPTKSQRAMRSAVPYMLEDELAQDVDDLFFAYANIANTDDDKNCCVAVVDRAQMQLWQAWLAAANIHTKTMQPDTLAMPYIAGQWSAIALEPTSVSSNETQIIVRQGEWQGGTLDSSAWQFVLAHRLSASQKTKESHEITINAYSQLPYCDESSSYAGFTVVKEQEELPLALLAQHCHHSKFNLLQGEYKINERRSKNVNNWLWAAGFAACALLLNVSYKSVKLWQLSTQQTQIEAQIIARYQQAFPQAKKVRIGTIKSQLNRKITQLGGTSEQVGFLTMMAKIQPAFAKVPALKPESLKFDGNRQELRLQAIADDYQHFERFKGALNTANLDVKPGAQNSQGEQVTGSFSISNKQSSKGGS